MAQIKKKFFLTLQKPLKYNTVRKAKRDAGPKHVGTENSVSHIYILRGPIYVVGGFFRSFCVDDGIFLHPLVLVMHHARLFLTVKSCKKNQEQHKGDSACLMAVR
jgi:hypothetical protein